MQPRAVADRRFRPCSPRQEQVEESRFANAIASDDGNLLARISHQVDVTKELLFAALKGQVLNLQLS